MTTHAKCVHTEHCCNLHGCKYGDDDCPVVLGIKPQSFLCEECGEDERGASESDHLRTEVNRLTAQLALARKALAPFARAAGRFDPQGNTLADNRRQQTILWSAKDREYEITSQDCLAAREALQVISGNTGGQGDDH